MNIVLDERTKHRLTGLVVILAIGIIFVPAILKKSNQRLEENIHVSVQLPPKPVAPNVAAVDEQAIFKSVKVASVTLPTPAESAPPVSNIARIDNLTSKSAAVVAVKTANMATVVKTPKVIKKITPVEAYMVQLAAFSVQQNAEKLVSRLRAQGYKARYQTTESPEGVTYKVTVGQLSDHADARLLKNKLNETTHLEGFIVKREIG